MIDDPSNKGGGGGGGGGSKPSGGGSSRTSGNPPNMSGDPEGYNTKLFPNPAAVRLALRGLWRFGGKRSDMAASGSRIAIDPIELDGFLKMDLGFLKILLFETCLSQSIVSRGIAGIFIDDVTELGNGIFIFLTF